MKTSYLFLGFFFLWLFTSVAAYLVANYFFPETYRITNEVTDADKGAYIYKVGDSVPINPSSVTCYPLTRGEVCITVEVKETP